MRQWRTSLLNEDGGNPVEDPGLDRTYELLVEKIRECYEQEQREKQEEPEE